MSIPIAMGVKDAAAALSLSPWTVRKYISQGRIPFVRIGRRVLIEAAEIERLIQQGRVKGGK